MLVSQTGLLLSICSSGSMSSGKTQSYRAKGSGSHCKHNWLIELAIYRPATPISNPFISIGCHIYTSRRTWLFPDLLGWWLALRPSHVNTLLDLLWLVVWMVFISVPILGIIFPTDFHIFQWGRSITNQ
jgi:hypothetical protein